MVHAASHRDGILNKDYIIIIIIIVIAGWQPKDVAVVVVISSRPVIRFQSIRFVSDSVSAGARFARNSQG